MIEMDQGLRREVASGLRDSLSATFDRVRQGQETQAREMTALAAGLRDDQERLRALFADPG